LFLKSQNCSYDVICLTETWLNSSFYNNELFCNKFDIYRKDRHDSHESVVGGGVLIAVNNNLASNIFNIPCSNEIELLCVKISFGKSSVFVINLYLPPNSNDKIYKTVINALDYVLEFLEGNDEIIIVGDFNLPGVAWTPSEDGNHFVSSEICSRKDREFVDSICCDMQQQSNVKNPFNKQLDLVFSTDSSKVVVSTAPTEISKIDLFHPPLKIIYQVDSNEAESQINHFYYYDFRKTDFVKLNNLIEENFNNICLISDNIDDVVTKFYALLFQCITKVVPVRRKRFTNTNYPWYNVELRSLKNKKNGLWKKFIRTNNEVDLTNYNKISDAFFLLNSTLYNQYIDNTGYKVLSDPKHFWAFINTKKKSDGYPSSFVVNDEIVKDSNILSELFCKMFNDSFSSDNFSPDANFFQYMESLPKFNLNSSLSINDEDIFHEFSKLDDDFSSGPDGIPPALLKMCGSTLCKPLAIIFSRSLFEGSFPQLWKTSFISPIFKKGCKKNICNYRPIAKLSCIPKVFEKLVYNLIKQDCYKVISSRQHGFIKGRSTTSNLLEFSSFCLSSFESRNQVDCVYTDFSKAFDKLSHSLILFKLRALEFPTVFVNWIESYLTNRTYVVRFRECESRPFVASSGVPQGSHLGPLLFVLAINDIAYFLKHSHLLIYADDMKLYRIIHEEKDCTLLQEDLNSFASWCSNNSLILNANKCQKVSFSRKKSVISFDYSINNIYIDNLNSIKDLGVIFDSVFTFNDHIHFICQKASSMLGFIKRWAKEFNNTLITVSLFTTLIRPHLEYASQVWAPHYNCNINRIERIQKIFVKFALNHLNWSDPLNLPPYSARLKLLNLESLETRRQNADIVYIHQLISGCFDSPDLFKYINFNTNRRSSRSNNSMFYVPFCRTNYSMNAPINRMCVLANNCNVFDINVSKFTLKKNLKCG
jgi:hypothetical protein